VEEQLTTRVAEQVGASTLRARQSLWITQSFFFFAIAVCVAIYHGHHAYTDGISFYGVYPPTMPVLFAAYLTAAGGLWWTANLVVDTDAPAWMRPAIRWIAVGLVVLLATPYNQGPFLNWSHMVAGVSMAVPEVTIAVGLIRRRASFTSIAALAVLLGGGAMGAISLPTWHISLLLPGECLLELGFAWSLLEWTYLLRARAH
jgi:hypothetical protein